MFMRCLEEFFSSLRNLIWMIYEEFENIDEEFIKSCKVKVSRQEISTHEDSGQKFEFINEGVDTWN